MLGACLVGRASSERMPRYHFNIRDDAPARDVNGAELSGLAAARVEAVRLAGDLLRDRAVTFWDDEEWRLDVTNARGLLLFTLHLVATDG